MIICYTGGGTGGHIFPVFPINSELLRNDSTCKPFFIGRYSELEQSWVQKEGIEYYPIQSGKLRRYASIHTFVDAFRVVIGIFQALYILKKKNASIVFSKGGYVSVPVVVASKILGIPTICHESDATPGLANRIAIRCSSTMCVAHEDVIHHFPLKQRTKCIVTGVPSRLNKESYVKHKEYPTPLLVILGGSLGALQINELVAPILPELTLMAYIVHQTGVGKGIYFSHPNYEAHEFIEKEYIDILAQADIVISRSGATSLADYIEMEVPSILIPLGRNASRGDQILNAQRLEKMGGAIVLDSEHINSQQLLFTIDNALDDKDMLQKMRIALKKSHLQRAETLIASIILDTVE